LSSLVLYLEFLSTIIYEEKQKKIKISEWEKNLICLLEENKRFKAYWSNCFRAAVNSLVIKNQGNTWIGHGTLQSFKTSPRKVSKITILLTNGFPNDFLNLVKYWRNTISNELEWLDYFRNMDY